MTGDRAPDTQPARPRDCTATARSASETTRSHRSASDRPHSCALPPASALRPQCHRESFPMAPADQWPQADRLSPRAPPAAYPCRKSPVCPITCSENYSVKQQTSHRSVEPTIFRGALNVLCTFPSRSKTSFLRSMCLSASERDPSI